MSPTDTVEIAQDCLAAAAEAVLAELERIRDSALDGELDLGPCKRLEALAKVAIYLSREARSSAPKDSAELADLSDEELKALAEQQMQAD